jgi:hypothetical protein
MPAGAKVTEAMGGSGKIPAWMKKDKQVLIKIKNLLKE